MHIDLEYVWERWKKEDIQGSKEFAVDFDFYSGDKEGVEYFLEFLESNGFKVKVKCKRILIVLKGYEINAVLETNWSQTKLKEMISLLGMNARKYNTLIEGYGAFVMSNNS